MDDSDPAVPEVRSGADLRCSDVDRERVAEALRNAAGSGRLTLAELEERLEATFAARTYGDLQPITRDLPQGPYPVPGSTGLQKWAGDTAASRPAQRVTPGAPAVRSQRITSILGDEKRRGQWEVPERIDVTAVCGSVELDFTDAIVRAPEVVISGAVVLSSLTIIVPEGADVRMDSAVVLGDRKMTLQEPATPGGPVYWVKPLIVLGEIKVRPPKRKRRLPPSE